MAKQVIEAGEFKELQADDVRQAVLKLKENIEWRAPSGARMKHAVLERKHAEALLVYAITCWNKQIGEAFPDGGGDAN